jgi:2-oxoglutarate dehydrogenase complex dehydrogenase (E1) component-like enzyme
MGGAICNGMAHRGRLNIGKHIWQIYTRYFRRIEGKDYDKDILTVMLSII